MFAKNPQRSKVEGSNDSILRDHARLLFTNPGGSLLRWSQPESTVWAHDCLPQRSLDGQTEQSTESDRDTEARLVAKPQEPKSIRESQDSAVQRRSVFGAFPIIPRAVRGTAPPAVAWGR